MDTEVHKQIMKEVANNFKMDNKIYEYLINTTALPDVQYEIKVSKIEKISSEKIAEITTLYDSLEPEGFWEWLQLSAGKWGLIFLEKSGSTLLQAIEYHSWIIEHGPNAPDNFLKHFKNAYNDQGENKNKEIAFCVHYLVDTGTPFHRKDLMDIEIPQDLDSDQDKIETISKVLKFLRSAFIWHQSFEKNIRNAWFDSKYSPLYNEAILRGIADGFSEINSVSNLESYFENKIQELSSFSKSKCQKLEEKYGLEEDTIADNIEFHNISSECMYQISKLNTEILACFFQPKVRIVEGKK